MVFLPGRGRVRVDHMDLQWAVGEGGGKSAADHAAASDDYIDGVSHEASQGPWRVSEAVSLAQGAADDPQVRWCVVITFV